MKIEQKDPVMKMMDDLIAPYGRPDNYSELLSALREKVTPEEAEVWYCYPDFSYNTDPVTREEAEKNFPFQRRREMQACSDSLINKGMLLKTKGPRGKEGYQRTYLFYIIYGYMFDPDGSRLQKELFRWWDYVREGGSAQLVKQIPPYRVLPQEAAVTGDSRHSKIPMNLEIPDQRRVLPMDKASRLVRQCDPIAVTKCICRMERDIQGDRPCDFPLEVCIIFNEAARDAVDMGVARYITADEALDIMGKCNDMGLVQTFSNVEHPLACCNCCSCCCICLRSIERGEKNVLRVSRYLAEAAKPGECIDCGRCTKVCPMGAVKLDENGPHIDGSRCIGCGICAGHCPKGVLKLDVRPHAQSKPDIMKEQRIYM